MFTLLFNILIVQITLQHTLTFQITILAMLANQFLNT